MGIVDKIKEAKVRYIVGFLIGTILAAAFFISFFVEYPTKNEVILAKLETVFEMAFAAFIQHIMKTPDNEKLK